jgi:BASS family bile acid:Na+ symporter
MGELLHAFQKLAVLVFLVGSMLGMGLNLTPRAIMAPLSDQKLVVVSLILNFLVAPGFAWLLTTFAPLDRGYAVGLLLLGGAAGAPFIPKLVEMAKGDLPLAIAVMTLLTAGTILFMPFALPLMIPGFQASPWQIARPLILFILLPMALGMLVKARMPAAAAMLAPIAARAGSVALLVLFVLLVALNTSALIGVVGSGAIFAVGIYFTGLLLAGWLLGGSNRTLCNVLALATAARNFAAAIVPAANSFQDPKVMVMLIVSAVVCLLLTFLSAIWIRRRGDRTKGR